MKKYFAILFFALLGCGNHSFDEAYNEFFGISSSSDFSSSSEASRSSLLLSSSSHLSSSSLSLLSSSSRLGNSSSSVQIINNEEEEAKLYSLIMQYRAEKGLPEIPLSESLTYVAQIHVRDLHENYFSYDAQCNMHSWSNKGDWTPCCYTADHAYAKCMWDKPRELTSYTGSGYEIAHNQSTAEGALNGWKNSSGHNAVIINEGSWENNEWRAIGVGIYGAFAVVWFGIEPDGNGDDSGSYCELSVQDISSTFCLELPSDQCSADFDGNKPYIYTYKKVSKCKGEPDGVCFVGKSGDMNMCTLMSKSYCRKIMKAPVFKTIKECSDYNP